MEKKGYHKLIVWQRAREFVKVIYSLSSEFPNSEEFGLKNQIRRAAASVVLNIVEGYRRNSTKDYLHFLNIAQGSLTEFEASLELCLDLHFITKVTYEEVEHKRGEVSFLLFNIG